MLPRRTYCFGNFSQKIYGVSSTRMKAVFSTVISARNFGLRVAYLLPHVRTKQRPRLYKNPVYISQAIYPPALHPPPPFGAATDFRDNLFPLIKRSHILLHSTCMIEAIFLVAFNAIFDTTRAHFEHCRNFLNNVPRARARLGCKLQEKCLVC